MKRHFLAALLAALSLACVPTVNADSNGDLIAGFTTQSGNDQIYDLGPLTSLTNGQTWSASTLGISSGTYNWGVIGSASAASSGYAYGTVWTTVAAGIPPPITSPSDWNVIDVGISTIANNLPGGLGGSLANTGASVAADAANSWNAETINGSLATAYHNAYLNPNVVNQATACLYTVKDGPSSPLVLAGTFTLSTNGTLTFNIPSTPAAGFTGTPASGFAPLQVVFSDASSGNFTNWLWDFGDGNSITNNTNASVTNTYAAAGNYTVTLTVSGAAGASTLMQFNYVSVSPLPDAPVAGFTGTPASGYAPLQVVFSDDSSGSITNWLWDFGDGNAITNNTSGNVTNTYAAAGNYAVTLTVSGAGGMNTDMETNYVVVSSLPAAPVAGFSGTPASGFAPLPVVFSDASSGSITNLVWDFGDGNVITNNTNGNVSNTYAAAGNYAVTLTVSGAGGTSAFTQTNYVTVAALPAPPIAGFSGTPTNGLAPLPVVFSDASSGSITNWLWDFGDGNAITNNTSDNVTNTYAAAGNYTVTLTVSGAGGMNTDTETNYVTVSDLPGDGMAGLTGTQFGRPTQLQGAPGTGVSITLNMPACQLNVSAGAAFTFSWQTTDTNASATINLYLDANNDPSSGLIPIASGLPNQTASGLNTSYVWQASSALAGANYYVYATLTDGTTTGSFAPGQLQIDPVGAFQLLSGIVATNATYVWQYSYYGTNYTGTNQLALGANVISVTNGAAIYQFIVTRLPSLAQVEAVQYNQLNQAATTTNGNGIVTTLTYDPLGRLIQRQSSNGALVTYAYDVLGNRTNMMDYTGATFYGYDSLSRLKSVTTSQSGILGGSDNLVLSYEYDLAGHETAIVYPGGERIQYTYDNAGRLKTVNNVTRSLLFQYTYNPTTGQLTKLNRPNGIETDYAYDGMGRLTNLLHKTSGTGALVAQYGYALDAIGKATLLTTTLPGGVVKFEQYGYDYFDRLTNVIYADSGILNDPNALNVSYTYDGNGNRMTMTTKTNNAVTEIRTYAYGNENRLLTVSNQVGVRLNAYFYDPAGNRIQKIATNYTAFYTYDERNLMTSYGDQTNQIAYTYNGDAQRVSQTLNGALTSYIVDPNRSLFQVVQQRNASGTITASYTFGGTRLVTWNGSAVTFELNDPLGSVRYLIDATGNVLNSYNYNVFGENR